MNFRRSLAISFPLVLLLTGSAQARWAKPEDMDAEVETSDYQVLVHRDGTFVETMDERDLILKDSARVARGIVRIPYNPELTRFELVRAETLNERDGKTVSTEVSPQMIEDKPLASSGEGFDQWHQVMIAFPGVDVGSRVHLKYRMTWFKVTSPGFFSSSLGFGSDYQKSGHIEIKSEVPLFTDINNPEDFMSMKQFEMPAERFAYQMTLDLRRPILKLVVDESDPFLEPQIYPNVDVATSQVWSDVSRTVVGEYEEILSASLPASFDKIAQKIKLIDDPVEKLNALTSLLADEVRYLGDWRTIKGKWVPRSLETIASSKFGDCKDFAAAITAILRKTGVQAQVAWVWRGWSPVVARYGLPSNYRFNHAISRVEVGGRVFWLDGTNVASFAQGVLGDISDRPALVLSQKQSHLERVVAPRPGDFSYKFDQQFDFSKPDQVDVHGSFESRGGDAANWINGNYNASRDSLDYKVIRSAARTDNFTDGQVTDFNIKTRQVNDLKAKFHYTDLAVGYRSTSGLIYPILFPDAVDHLLFSPAHRESDVLLGEPFVYERDMLFKNIQIVGSESMSCAVDSPWILVKRNARRTHDGLRIQDSLTLKVNHLSSDQYKTPEFAKLQRQLTHCFLHSSIIHRDRTRK